MKSNLPYILLLILAPIIFYFTSTKLLKYLRAQNLKHLEYDIEGVKRNFTDYAFSPIRNHLIYNDYHLETENRKETQAVMEVREKFPELNQYIGNKKFYNYWRVMAYFQSEGKYNIEKKLLIHLLTDSPYFDFEDDYENFCDYIYEYYLYPSQRLIDNHQYSRAKWMINKALQRSLIVDTQPVKVIEEWRDYINKVILQRCLINNPEDAVLETKNFRAIYDILTWGRISRKELNEIRISETSEYYPFWLYLNGTILLQEKKVAEAFNIFKEVSKKNKSNTYLNDLNLHLLARCIFWSCHNNNLNNRTKHISQLNKIKRKISVDNLKSDIDHYISFLENPPTEYYEKEDFNEKNNIDFILELNL